MEIRPKADDERGVPSVRIAIIHFLDLNLKFKISENTFNVQYNTSFITMVLINELLSSNIARDLLSIKQRILHRLQVHLKTVQHRIISKDHETPHSPPLFLP